jgi:cytochrome c oxidase subunit 4
MTDTHDTGHDHGHGSMFKLYMVVAVCLSVFTAVSFVVNALFHESAPVLAFLIILSVAIAKATLVGLYFMHLKYDWSRLYFMIVPAFIIATMMMIVLMPDVVLAWHREPYTNARGEKYPVPDDAPHYKR